MNKLPTSETCKDCNYMRSETACCKCGIYMATPTPETNAVSFRPTRGFELCVPADFAQNLEWERNEARKHTSRLHKELIEAGSIIHGRMTEIQRLQLENYHLLKICDALKISFSQQYELRNYEARDHKLQEQKELQADNQYDVALNAYSKFLLRFQIPSAPKSEKKQTMKTEMPVEIFVAPRNSGSLQGYGAWYPINMTNGNIKVPNVNLTSYTRTDQIAQQLIDAHAQGMTDAETELQKCPNPFQHHTNRSENFGASWMRDNGSKAIRTAMLKN